VLYSVLTESGIPRKLVGLIQTCLHETYSTVRTGKYQSDKFPVQNGLKQRKLYHRCFSTFLWNTPLEGPKKTREG
jgi:hypothetical protein